MIIWSGVDQSTRAPRMSFGKRLRVLYAALTQDWHTKTCSECGFDWLAVGSATELISICDRCEIKAMDKFSADMERKFQQEFKQGAA